MPRPWHPQRGGVCFGLKIETDDLGMPKTSSKADEQHGPIPQAAQRAAIKRLDHGDDILSHDRFLLDWWLGVAVADAGHHGGDMPVFSVKHESALGKIPGEGGEEAFDG